jgi:hypothetical protein
MKLELMVDYIITDYKDIDDNPDYLNYCSLRTFIEAQTNAIFLVKNFMNVNL